MREYAKFSPSFWTDAPGKQLRGDASAQVLAAYLKTAPASTMLGLYYLPLPTVAHETGLSLSEVERALDRLAELGIAMYDPDAELVFLPAEAVEQIGPEVQPRDHQRKGLLRQLERFRDHAYAKAFRERYGAAYHLDEAGDPSPSGAPPKGRRRSSEGASSDSPTPSKAHASPSEGASKPLASPSEAPSKALARGGEERSHAPEAPSKPGAGSGAGTEAGERESPRALAHEGHQDSLPAPPPPASVSPADAGPPTPRERPQAQPRRLQPPAVGPGAPRPAPAPRPEPAPVPAAPAPLPASPAPEAPNNAQAALILEKLRLYPALLAIATTRVAERLAGRVWREAIKLELILQCIEDFGAKAQAAHDDGVPWERLGEKLEGYINTAKRNPPPPRPGGPGGGGWRDRDEPTNTSSRLPRIDPRQGPTGGSSGSAGPSGPSSTLSLVAGGAR